MVDNFSKFGRALPLKNKNSHIIKNSLENILITSKREPNLFKTDDGNEFVNKNFTDFSKKNNSKRYIRYTSLGAVFAECFNRTVRDLPRKFVSQTIDGICR